MGESPVAPEKETPRENRHSPYDIPINGHLKPGKTYVGRVPGHKNKVFVRKRPRKADPKPDRGFRITYSASERPHRFRATLKMGIFSRSNGGYYTSYSKPRYVCVRDRGDYYKPSGGSIVTGKRQTCVACGKFRSAKWEADHPLIDGVAIKSGLCGRCKHKDTSSEEKDSRKYSKRHRSRRYSRHDTCSNDDSYCSSRDRSPRRYRSYRSGSREYARHRAKKNSRDNIRIVIANQPGERSRRHLSRSSSAEPIRLVRRTSYVELPKRLRSRSGARSSSHISYIDEDSAQDYEDLMRPRRRSRSRSCSRGSFIELDDRSPRRKRQRSSSRVQFVDDLDEPILVSKPRCISRRRAVYFDGAGSFEQCEREQEADATRSESRGRSQSHSHLSHRPSMWLEGQNADAEDLQGITIRQFQTSSSAKEHDDERIPVGESLAPRHWRRSSSSSDASTAQEKKPLFLENAPARPLNGVYYRQPIDQSHSSDVYLRLSDSQRDLSPSSIRHYEYPYAQECSKYVDAEDKTTSNSFDDELSTTTRYAAGPEVQSKYTEGSRPRNKRRRTDRDGSADEHYDPETPISYRHIRAPQSRPDYLSHMPRESHITPPRRLTGGSYEPSKAVANLDVSPSPMRNRKLGERRSVSFGETSCHTPNFWTEDTGKDTIPGGTYTPHQWNDTAESDQPSRSEIPLYAVSHKDYDHGHSDDVDMTTHAGTSLDSKPETEPGDEQYNQWVTQQSRLSQECDW